MKILLPLLALSLATFVQAQPAPEHRAWIDTQQQNNTLTIQGKFANRGSQDVSFRYELVTTKQGKSGSSSSTQAGSFSASGGEEVSLSTTALAISEEDKYVIELKVFRGDTVYLENKSVR